MQGWIKLHRRIIDHWIWQDPEYLRMWIYLLLDANHEDRKIIWNKNVIEVKRGEKITSLKKLAYEFNCSREKVRHFLNLLKKDTMITIDSNTNYTHIKICNYDSYQIEQHGEKTAEKQRENSGKTAGDTNKNDKNDKNEKENINTIVDYLNNKTGKNFKSSSRATRDKIKARMNEKYTVDDFKKVIDNKVSEWQGTDMDKYLRPETLFSPKFEGYLNQKPKIDPTRIVQGV